MGSVYDVFERKLKIGDLIAYPVRRGSIMYQGKARVEGFEQEETDIWVVCMKLGDTVNQDRNAGRRIKVRPKNVVLVGRQSAIPYLED